MPAENRAVSAPGSSPVLALQNIQKSFGDLSVLRDISLSVEQGNVVSVIGPSGYGHFSGNCRCREYPVRRTVCDAQRPV